MVTHLKQPTRSQEIASSGVTVCRDICRKYGKKYYLATFFLPKLERQATWILYAFVRIADEIVDTEERDTLQAKTKLDELYARWENVYAGRLTDSTSQTDTILFLTKDVFTDYAIPFEYSTAFFKAMLADTQKSRYATYLELQEYMYGSAAVVGLMMSHIIGYDRRGTSAAVLLGEAMQITNFLRDIKEDFAERDRIYLPQEDLASYHISENNLATYIASGRIDDNFREYMQRKVAHNRAQYQEANQGIIYLSKRGRLGVYVASKLYAKILDKIEENGYNVFEKRVYVTKREKITITLSCIWNLKIKKSL